MVPLFLRELDRSGIPVRPLASTITRPLAGGIAAVIAMAVVSPTLSNTVARLLVLGAVGAATYGAVVVPANPVLAKLGQQVRGRTQPAEVAA
jgi:hypothetical protein